MREMFIAILISLDIPFLAHSVVRYSEAQCLEIKEGLIKQ